MATRLVIQSSEMRLRGLGWMAQLCPNPDTCEERLCLEVDLGRRVHPVDPPAFAQWRVHARINEIPRHVLVTAGAVESP